MTSGDQVKRHPSETPCTTAVILVAGVGSRLRPLTESCPKALVPVLDRPMLEIMLEQCQRAGLRRVILVTGYRHEDIDAWVASHPQPSLRIETIFNPDFATQGNARSLLAAAPALKDVSWVKLDGDLLASANVLRQVLTHSGNAMALDHRAILDAEAMKARVQAGCITALGKKLATDLADAETLGLEKISAADAPALFEAIRATLKRGDTQAYYEDVYHTMFEQGFQLDPVVVDGPWCEVDDHDDLRLAHGVVASFDATAQSVTTAATAAAK